MHWLAGSESTNAVSSLLALHLSEIEPSMKAGFLWRSYYLKAQFTVQLAKQQSHARCALQGIVSLSPVPSS